MTRAVRSTAIAVSFAALAGGCKPTAPGVQKTGPAVAQGDGSSITADRAQGPARRAVPFLRQRYQTLDRKKSASTARSASSCWRALRRRRGCRATLTCSSPCGRPWCRSSCRSASPTADAQGHPRRRRPEVYDEHTGRLREAGRGSALAAASVAAHRQGPGRRRAPQARKVLAQVRGRAEEYPGLAGAGARRRRTTLPARAAAATWASAPRPSSRRSSARPSPAAAFGAQGRPERCW